MQSVQGHCLWRRLQHPVRLSSVIEELDSSGTDLETGPLYLSIGRQAKDPRSQAKSLFRKLFWIQSSAQMIGRARPLGSVA